MTFHLGTSVLFFFFLFLVISSHIEKHDSWKSVLAPAFISCIIQTAVMLEEIALAKGFG